MILIMKCKFYFKFKLFIKYNLNKIKNLHKAFFKLIKNYYYSYTNIINTHYVVQPDRFLLLYLGNYNYSNMLINISLKKWFFLKIIGFIKCVFTFFTKK